MVARPVLSHDAAAVSKFFHMKFNFLTYYDLKHGKDMNLSWNISSILIRLYGLLFLFAI
jgi:hypothetical protein